MKSISRSWRPAVNGNRLNCFARVSTLRRLESLSLCCYRWNFIRFSIARFTCGGCDFTKKIFDTRTKQRTGAVIRERETAIAQPFDIFDGVSISFTDFRRISTHQKYNYLENVPTLSTAGTDRMWRTQHRTCSSYSIGSNYALRINNAEFWIWIYEIVNFVSVDLIWIGIGACRHVRNLCTFMQMCDSIWQNAAKKPSTNQFI